MSQLSALKSCLELQFCIKQMKMYIDVIGRFLERIGDEGNVCDNSVLNCMTKMVSSDRCPVSICYLQYHALTIQSLCMPRSQREECTLGLP